MAVAVAMAVAVTVAEAGYKGRRVERASRRVCVFIFQTSKPNWNDLPDYCGVCALTVNDLLDCYRTCVIIFKTSKPN